MLLRGIAAAAACAVFLGLVGTASAQDELTPSAKATWKKLAQKISVDFQDIRMADAFEDIKREFNNRLGVRIDNVSGVSNNSKVTFKAEDQTLKKILDDFCTKYEIGYIVYSKAGERTDGFLIIRKTTERGYEKGKEPKEKSSLERPASDRALAANQPEVRVVPVVIALAPEAILTLSARQRR
jgi:hypothetical protein